MWTQPLDVDGIRKPLQGTAVELIHTVPERKTEVGLLFGDVSKKETLERALPTDSILFMGERPLGHRQSPATHD